MRRSSVTRPHGFRSPSPAPWSDTLTEARQGLDEEHRHSAVHLPALQRPSLLDTACRPSPCARALPGSEYYGGSAPPGPISCRCAQPHPSAGRDTRTRKIRNGSRVHRGSLDEGGARLCPGSSTAICSSSSACIPWGRASLVVTEWSAWQHSPLGVVLAVLRWSPPGQSVIASFFLLAGTVTGALLVVGSMPRPSDTWPSSVLERAATAERERDHQAQLAVAAERARDMHDIVAHGLSVMIALNDGAAARAGIDPADVEQAMRQASAVAPRCWPCRVVRRADRSAPSRPPPRRPAPSFPVHSWPPSAPSRGRCRRWRRSTPGRRRLRSPQDNVSPAIALSRQVRRQART